MERIKFIRYWPHTFFVVGIAVLAVFILSSTPAQAFSSDQSSALQGTPPAPTAPVLTPEGTLAEPPVIPETGGDTVIIDFFSSWVLWGVLGAVVIALLIALAARPAGPQHHHHHDDG